MDELPHLIPATADERITAEAAGLPVAAALSCWTVSDVDGAVLAYAVVLPGRGEGSVRAVTASDPGSPAQAEAAVAAREQLIAAAEDGSL